MSTGTPRPDRSRIRSTTLLWVFVSLPSVWNSLILPFTHRDISGDTSQSKRPLGSAQRSCVYSELYCKALLCPGVRKGSVIKLPAQAFFPRAAPLRYLNEGSTNPFLSVAPPSSSPPHSLGCWGFSPSQINSCDAPSKGIGCCNANTASPLCFYLRHFPSLLFVQLCLFHPKSSCSRRSSSSKKRAQEQYFKNNDFQKS